MKTARRPLDKQVVSDDGVARSAGLVTKLISSMAVAALLCVLSAAQARAAAATRADLITITYTSALLSEFWGVPTTMQASAYVPPGCQGAAVKCPVLYHLPGYGGTLAQSWKFIGDFAHMSARVPSLMMAHVFLDPNFHGGYSYYTDSQNNGPWDSALTREFIPYIENLLDVGGSPEGRFLEGHSSGGWTVMWLQVSNPEFFRGVWALAPDPIDFRHFYEVDITPGSTDNFYFKRNGAHRHILRGGDTMKHYMQHVDDDPTHGGIISSYEFAWSPRGPDGLPLRFFDRSDGSLIEGTLEAWQEFDIHALLAAGGDPLRGVLDGKIHVYCGTLDDFFYNEPTAAMCRFLRQNHWMATCQLVPGATHSTILDPSSVAPAGLHHLVLAQASKIFHNEEP